MYRPSCVLAAAVVLAVVLTGTPSGVSAQNAVPTILDVRSNFLFDVAVMKNTRKPFVVFYYSSRECPPCKYSLVPLLKKMVTNKGDHVNLATVDLDVVPEFRETHGIGEIPTTMVFYKGELMDFLEGKAWTPIVALVNRATKIMQ